MSNHRCEKCGVDFEVTGEITSSKVLCQQCAAERRAQLRAAKTKAGTAAPAAARATAAAAAAPSARAHAAPARAARAERPSRQRQPAPDDAGGHHRELDTHALHVADDKRTAKFGWMAVGGLTLVTLLVLVFVMNKTNTRHRLEQEYQQSLDTFVADLNKVDLNNEQALNDGKAKINSNRSLWKGTRIESPVTIQLSTFNTRVAFLIKTRGLKTKLEDLEAKLAGTPSLETLGQQFNAVRDAELVQEAAEAGGDLKSRYDQISRSVSQKYLEDLKKAVAGAASATTGDALAPYGMLEDALKTLWQEASAATDTEGIQKYEAMRKPLVAEINGTVTRLFDEAYLKRVQEMPLLANPDGWAASQSPSFKYNFAGSTLTMTNEDKEGAASGGLTYMPGLNWRDYVIEMEFKLDSGTMVFHTRVGQGEKMDPKAVPAFSIGVVVGSKSPNLALPEYNKSHTLTITTIGNMITVALDGSPGVWTDDHLGQKSRKGAPAIAVHPGTSVTITRLKVKHLR